MAATRPATELSRCSQLSKTSEHLLVAEVRDEGLLHAEAGARAHPEHCCHCADNPVVFAHRRQLAEPGALPESRQHLTRDLQRESAFSRRRPPP